MTPDLKPIALGAIIVTICAAFLAVIVAGIIGRPVDEATRLFVFGLFASLATASVAWLGVSQVSKAQTETALANLRVENAQTRVNEMETMRAPASPQEIARAILSTPLVPTDTPLQPVRSALSFNPPAMPMYPASNNLPPPPPDSRE